MIRACIRDNPEIVRRYVRSQLDAIAGMKTDRDCDQGAGEIPGANQDPKVCPDLKVFELVEPFERVNRNSYLVPL
jgi:hypothetical protein